ncbi:hypothetical protein [Mesorhizobium amorphae]|uniref:Uncharacterized protein n=1 Tax=Mesorhizobium amorphae CCNWGS0123 TaxID=1082933 RepID=G6YCC9_9HYPH|nr:hypothetical protein [Mesorhizobium amorphae]ANT53520.1 hypothetical protein A6B35_28415 [Mesorhizobium amorphae CCNWGS0123]EHH10608.1 hypothetical protein MEA186_18053 [Mesorhizobium amorphae CCNWGS0123]GLR41450.1 hypothetical protein GCM10007880_19660 [Mesorhizobium amorphae]
MGDVISFEKARAKQRRPPDPLVDPAFVTAWEAIFEALELVETIQLPRTERARELLLRGLGVMLEREQRRLGQCAK